MSNSRKRTSLVSIFLLSLFTALIFGSQPAMASYEINLATGWNLVSLPEQPTNTDIAEVTSSIHGKYESIWAYVNGSWKVYDPNNPGFSDLTTIEAGPGYWFNMSEDSTLSGSGLVPPNCLQLNVGWNLTGYNCSNTQVIATALQAIAGKYISVWGYVDGSWRVYDPNNPEFSDLSELSPGLGYWIHAAEATQLFFQCTSEPLSIVITSPTGEQFYLSSSSTVFLAGLTGGTVGSVTWSTDQGDSGTATGTSEWTTSPISLVEGDNVITCAAHGDAETAEATITVTYNTVVAFNSDLYINDDVLYLNEAKEIIFRIGIDPSIDSANLNVKLYQVDSQGNKITEIGSLIDNGNLDNGDEIDQDGIFSGKFSLSESEEGMIFVRVFATPNDSPKEAASGIKRIIVVPKLLPEDIDNAVSNADNAKAKFEELLGTAQAKGLIKIAAEEDAIEQTVAWLNEQPGIAKAGVSEGGGGFWFVNSNAILGGYVIPREGDKSGQDATSRYNDAKPNNNNVKLGDMELYPSQLQPKFAAIMAEGSDENEVGNSKAIYVGPYLAQFGNGDDYSGAWVQVKDSKCPTFDTIELKDNAVTIDTFKNLYKYGTVVISSHGNNWYKGLWSWWIDVFGSKKPSADLNWIQKKLSQPVIASGVKLAKDADENWVYGDYQNDLKTGRLAISASGTLYITPGFINFYNKTYPNSIVYMSICRGFYNSALADAFIAKGAGVFFGYSDYVSTGYAKPVGNTIFEEMLDNGKTFKEAYDEAVKKHGSSELKNNPADKWPAYVRYKGKSNLIFSSSFKNGSFESGNLNAWSKNGDGRVIAKLGAALPTDGSYMSIISTGLGYTTEHGEVSQDFCVADSATTLTFDWNFFSEEFEEWCGSIYQDWFTVTITDVESGTSTIIISKKIDDFCGFVTKVGNSFDQGDVYATGWQSLAPFDLTPYRGKAVKLKFSCNDVGDSIYDSAILVDNIVIGTE